MANYWIGDATGRVLGPLTLQALRDLIGSGRLRAVNRASRDGTTWIPLQDFTEVKDLIASALPTLAAEQQRAEALRTQLRGLQNLKTPHEVFGMKPTSSLDEVRLAFFRMAKRYAPEHLPAETSEALRQVSQETFDFLSQKMREVEALAPRGTPGRVPTPVPVAGRQPTPAPVAGPRLTPVPVAARPLPGSTAPMAPGALLATQVRQQITSPIYSTSEFVGLKPRDGERLQAEIHVNARSVGLFTEHRMINLATGGLFVPTPRPLRLGTQVDLTLRFEQPARTIELRTTVIWENALNDGRQPAGYGLGLSGLRAEEKSFLQEFVRHHPKD
ncbi:TIGR02266 family protein [Stigmatella erecta]|uniref:Myxococcus xanthus paralogous domain TIGR02266 n=1 Tax=Stigmatella erecta TaxID=83460 RepID=A0A1I0L911_9BACT|nr:TIGR02266 family protein [Stigmatella erecta]SEU36525.1 Myxococcus xanthus paralogous domain TIGR02266 [Stigmatella erecta]